MGLGTILIVVLVILLLGGLVPFGGAPAAPVAPYHGYGYGFPAGGLLGTLLVVVIILAVVGAL